MRLLLVHGIGPVRQTASELHGWVEALQKGMIKAGHSRLAATLDADPRVTFVNYSDIFECRGLSAVSIAGGKAVAPEEELVLDSQFVAEAIDAQLQQGRPAVAQELARARAQLDPEGQAQGFGALLRRLANVATTLVDIPCVRRGGQWLTGWQLLGDIAQVGAYFSAVPSGGQRIGDRIRERFMAAAGGEPCIVVAHSLGSVVAFEAIHEAGLEVPLLVTLGSPLAMRTVVLPRLQPQPPAVPPTVDRWLNYWDRDDIISARPFLEGDFAANGLGVVPVTDRIDSDGVWVHAATKYLAAAALAGQVAECWAAAGPPRVCVP
jgi:hypothetical protein